MKKRVLSLFMVLVLCLTLLPTVAFAEGEDVSISGGVIGGGETGGNIQFDGVNSSAEVWWNGEKIGSHDGGYSAFRVRIPEISDENILTVYALSLIHIS